MRGYTLQNGREASSWFMREGDFVISIASFFTQTPGDEYLELLEPGEGFSLSYEHLQQLYRDFPAFNFHGRMLTEHYYVQSELRARHLRTLPAAERYARLFAFVLFFNQALTPAAEADMMALTRALIDEAERIGGSYYLPYRRHATPAQLLRAYPQFPEFVRLKQKYDPQEVFQNQFYQQYHSAAIDSLL